MTLNEAYSPKTKSWATLASMPDAVAGANSAYLSTKLYCIGGSDTGVLGSGLAYDFVQIYQK